MGASHWGRPAARVLYQREVVAYMNALRAGCLAVALLFASAALAGCVGSEAGSGDAPAADDTGSKANDTADKTGSSDQTDDNVTDTDGNASEDDDATEEAARVPSDAMSGDPAESEPGRARFIVEDTAATSIDAVGGEAKTYELHNPGDLTFFDIYLTTSENDEQPAVTDLDLYVYNETGDEVASSAYGRTNEYAWFQPEEAGNFTIEVVPYISNEASYTMTVTAWTADDWNVSESAFVDSWQVTYEWGQAEVGPVTSVAFFPNDYTGLTEDGMINVGGSSWIGCGHNGGSENVLPCGQEPYTSVSVVIDDDVAGQQVAALWTTCSMDGDFVCGETDNRNDTGTDPEDCDGAASGGCPGPNELRATFCGVVEGITRDATSDADGTGPGIWDQRGEEYRTLDGSYEAHLGVDGMTVFLIGPQQGGGGVCSNANPYTGPTTGTITIIARK